jgi:hypothetical protein
VSAGTVMVMENCTRGIPVTNTRGEQGEEIINSHAIEGDRVRMETNWVVLDHGMERAVFVTPTLDFPIEFQLRIWMK